MSQAEALCRLCSKEKKPMVAILDNNPLNVREKMEKLVKIRVRIIIEIRNLLDVVN